MFNIRRTKKETGVNSAGSKSDLARYTERMESLGKTEFMENLISENKFIEQDIKMRSLVESILEKEFSSDIKKLKSYNIIVDAVINKLKKDQLAD